MTKEKDINGIGDIETCVKSIITSTISFTACIFLSIWILRGVITDDYTHIAVYIICIFTYSIIFILNKIQRLKKYSPILLVITLAIFSVYLFNTSTNNSNAYLWSLVIPLIIAILVKENHIFIANIIFMLSIIITYLILKPISHTLNEGSLLLRFILVYLSILISSFVTIRNKNSVFKQAEKTSRTDTLTNLYNRRVMNEIPEVVDGQSVVILMLDIDTFKKYNDSYGHVKGDQVLQELSSIILKEIKGKDIAIRYGGEEFLLVFNNVTIKEILPTVNAIKEQLRKTNIHHESSSFGRVTVSIGVAQTDSGIKDVNDLYRLINESDEKMYIVKEKGGNGIAY